MSNSIGIDLGTTLSAVSHLDDNGNTVIIPNKFGKKLTPSVFSIDQEGRIYIGDEAILLEQGNVLNTIRSIKRSMGTSLRKNVGNKEYSPEEISGHILNRLKSDAEIFLKQPITHAVITVPAYFNNDQRRSTQDAGKIAKLNILQIINEPTAAALAYGLGKSKNEKIIVFDLGGGTFDITVLNITDTHVFEVLATSGDTALGGDDFDNELINYFISCMNIEKDVSLIPLLRVILRNIAEATKIELSNKEEVVIENRKIKILNETYNLNCKITRDDFNKMIDKYVIKCKNCMNFAVRDAKLTYNNIDKIILVGGSTRVPYVRKKIQDWTGIAPDTSINPDEAVARGAAIQAALLSHQTDKKALLLDVIPLTLGIETYGGMMIKMIERNTTIPVDYENIFSTVEDNQECVAIRIFQGERPRATDNKCLGNFKLEEIEAAPKGVPQILVSFQVDMNGILSVVAKDETTGKYKQITVTGSSSISSAELDTILQDAAEHQEEDEILNTKFIIIKILRDRLIQINKLLETSSDVITTIDKTKLERFAKIIEEEDLMERDIENLQKIENSIEKIMNLASDNLKIKAERVIESYLVE